jgi:hypothetical protein
MASHDLKRSIEAHKRWLGYLQPDGLVVSAAALVDKGHYYQEAQRERQIEFIDHLLAFQQYDEEEGTVEITDFKALATEFLGLPKREWVDAADLGDAYHIPLKESPEVLSPSAALRWPRSKELAEGEPAYQILTKYYDGDLDAPYETAANTWSTSATRRFERLLRETGIPIGLLVSRTQLRLVSAPVGENAGSLTFRFADMVSTMGRPILGAFDLLLNAEMLFLGDESHQLPALLRHSRDMQANVSIELARQVLDGLYDLVRGTQAANARTEGKLLQHLLATNPNRIYEGQLTVLMRLVFLLFAEDRGLMPNSALYNGHYSLHSLYERLRQDHALHHDTMDARYGAWAQLLALFRLVFHGHRHKDLSLPPRYGYLFDPDRFPFLEGRIESASDQQSTIQNPQSEIPLIPDGTIFRLLQGLLFLNGERISYRTLDVEQIGSVYETMMGFALARAEGQTIAIRPQKAHGAAVYLNLDQLLSLRGTDRHNTFTEETGRNLTGTRLAEFNAATTTDELLAVFQGPSANSDLISRNATPHLAQPGSLLLQPTDARRKSGSHYTPRKLTEPIVRKALEPVLANLGENPFPAQILDLKVCDPAVGSGAFLVEACRQLGDELVKAWAIHGGKPVIPPDEDEVLHARRLIAQRCLYGVDRNPMAADLAKLSLWLATLAKDHPFTFLDHAIRSGDSLVGLSKKQILAFHWDLTHPSAKQRIFGQDVLEKKIKSALAYRQEILNAGDLVLPELKAAQLNLAEQEIDKVRRAGDLAVLGFFSGAKPKERQDARDELLERWLKATDQSGSEESLHEGIGLKREIGQARDADKSLAPFHWEVEYPEVYTRSNEGFDCFVGNPPFAGKNNILRTNSSGYVEWLQFRHPDSHGNSDLVAHFYRLSFAQCRNGGTLGLVATTRIGEGDTCETGLKWITRNHGDIFAATDAQKWPGDAAVQYRAIHVYKGLYTGLLILGSSRPGYITPELYAKAQRPSSDSRNAPEVREISTSAWGESFVGCGIQGAGFMLEAGEANELLKKPENHLVVRPFLIAKDLNSSFEQRPSRYVIDFDNQSLEQARRFSDCLQIVEARVKPDRDKNPRKAYRTRWWLFGERRAALRESLADRDEVIACAMTTMEFKFALCPSNMVFDQTLVVISPNSEALLAVLESTPHKLWACKYGASFGSSGAPRYNPSRCFSTYPFPETSAISKTEDVVAAGSEFFELRTRLMRGNQEGLTKTYNRFHDPGETSPDIHKLRELHAAMDRAVLDAYGWTDVPTDCEFIPDFTEEDDDGNEIPKNIRYRWPDEVRDDVLARLLALNAERHAAEVNAGLHAKGTQAAKKTAAAKKAAATKKTTRRAPDDSQPEFL